MRSWGRECWLKQVRSAQVRSAEGGEKVGQGKFTEGDEKGGQGMLLSEVRRWDREDLLKEVSRWGDSRDLMREMSTI